MTPSDACLLFRVVTGSLLPTKWGGKESDIKSSPNSGSEPLVAALPQGAAEGRTGVHQAILEGYGRGGALRPPGARCDGVVGVVRLECI